MQFQTLACELNHSPSHWKSYSLHSPVLLVIVFFNAGNQQCLFWLSCLTVALVFLDYSFAKKNSRFITVLWVGRSYQCRKICQKEYTRSNQWWEITLMLGRPSDIKSHDDVIKWKHFPRHWSFVWGIHRSPVNSLHKGQWRRALMLSLICVWTSGWLNNRGAGEWHHIESLTWVTQDAGHCFSSVPDKKWWLIILRMKFNEN